MFSAESEIVRRYLRHTKKLKKPCKYESLILPNISETLVNSKNTEANHDRKPQMDLQAVIIDSSENWNSVETESSQHSDSITNVEISKFQKPLSIPELILPIPTFSANHRLIQPKIGLLTSVPSQKLIAQQDMTSVSESVNYLEHVGRKCFKMISDMKAIKLLEKKLRYPIDLSSLYTDSKLGKLLKNSCGKEFRQLKKESSEILVGFFAEKCNTN